MKWFLCGVVGVAVGRQPRRGVLVFLFPGLWVLQWVGFKQWGLWLRWPYSFLLSLWQERELIL